MTRAGIRADAQPLYLQLLHQQTQLEAAGNPVPCQTDPDPFTSDDAGERAEAAEACRHACPLIDLCGAYADAQGEKWFVWGGVDKHGRKK